MIRAPAGATRLAISKWDRKKEILDKIGSNPRVKFSDSGQFNGALSDYISNYSSQIQLASALQSVLMKKAASLYPKSEYSTIAGEPAGVRPAN